MTPFEIVVALLRGAHVVALVSLFGTLVFLTLVAPSALAEATIEAPYLRRRLLRLARISAPLALVIGIAWLAVESAVIAGADSVAMTLHAVPVATCITTDPPKAHGEDLARSIAAPQVGRASAFRKSLVASD